MTDTTEPHVYRVSEIRDGVLRRDHGYYASLGGAFAYCEAQERTPSTVATARFELFPVPGGEQWMIHTYYGPDDPYPEISDLVITRVMVIPDASSASPAAVEPPADQTTPSHRAGLREQIAGAMREHYLSSNRDEADADRNMPCVCGDWREPGVEADDENDWDSHLADVVLVVLSLEWPWLRAEAEDAAPPAEAADRDRIAEAALAAVETALRDTLTADVRAEALAGITAVLPAPADQAAVLREAVAKTLATADGWTWAHGLQFKDISTPSADAYRKLADAVLAVLPSADRASVLREAALHLYTALFPAVYNDLGQKAAEGVNRAVSELRRMADETATTETPFTPPAHYRRDDGVECCVHTIPVGPDSCPACRELAHNGPAAGPIIVDQVVAALQAKAQALSVEAEEEMRRDLEEQAQVWHEAADLARRTGRRAARSTQPAAGARQDGSAS